MNIVLPAYNIDPKLATRFEDQVARVMHRNRWDEINRLREKDKTAESARPPMHNKPAKPSQFTQPRPNNEMDYEVLHLLRHQWLSVAMIAQKIGRTPQAARHMVARLYALKLLHRRDGMVTMYCAVGEDSQNGCA